MPGWAPVPCATCYVVLYSSESISSSKYSQELWSIISNARTHSGSSTGRSLSLARRGRLTVVVIGRLYSLNVDIYDSMSIFRARISSLDISTKKWQWVGLSSSLSMQCQKGSLAKRNYTVCRSRYVYKFTVWGSPLCHQAN